METTVKYTHLTVDSQRRFYKMYHSRKNSYFKEVDRSYMDKIEEREKFNRNVVLL